MPYCTCGKWVPTPINPAPAGPITEATALQCWQALARHRGYLRVKDPDRQQQLLAAQSVELAGLLAMILRGEKVETESSTDGPKATEQAISTIPTGAAP